MGLLVKSEVKRIAKKLGLRFPDNVVKKFEKKVEELIKQAAKRAKGNKRLTLREYDF